MNDSSPLCDAHASGLLSIDLDAVRSNFRLLCETAGSADVAAVVKANAYGLDAARIAPILFNEGCRAFFVAQLAEARELKTHLPAAAEIYILNGLPPGSEQEAAASGVIPVLNSLEQIAAWAVTGMHRDRRLPAVVQVDTGMSRLGLTQQEVDYLLLEPELLERIRPVLLMSHLACADEPNNPSNNEQLSCFRRLAARLPIAKRSIANSGGTFLGPAFQCDLVRSGIAIYGAAPMIGVANPMRPTVRLDTRVIQIRDVPRGTGVGYGLTIRTAEPARLATLGVGYADGWPRSLSGCGAVYVHGVRAPIVGRVSMDSMVVDVTAVPRGRLRVGDFVELLGKHQTLDDVARDAGTIAYEILTGLGQRFERVYLDKSATQSSQFRIST